MGSEEENIDSLEVVPMIDEQPLFHGELIGDVLSVISLKNPSHDSDPDRVVERNSFRDLHHPNISHLSWVSDSTSKEEAVFEKVKSVQYSRLSLSSGGSSREMMAGSGLERGGHSYSAADGPIPEESLEHLTATEATNPSLPTTNDDEDDVTDEYIIRRQTLGELSFTHIQKALEAAKAAMNDPANAANEYLVRRMTLGELSQAEVDAAMAKMHETAAVAWTQPRGQEGQAYKPYKEDKYDTDKTSADNDVASLKALESRLNEGILHLLAIKSRERRRSFNIETLHTYSAMDAMEQQKLNMQQQQQQQQRGRQRVEKDEDEPDVEEEEAEEEEEDEDDLGRENEDQADDVAATTMTTHTGVPPPLSRSPIRTADAVSVDMLDRAILEDISQIPRRKSKSCHKKFASVIVGRVLDSVRNRVERESRLPPTKTWEEQAMQTAVLLVQDVIASALIYVIRNGAIDPAVPTPKAEVRIVEKPTFDDEGLQSVVQFQDDPELLSMADHDEIDGQVWEPEDEDKDDSLEMSADQRKFVGQQQQYQQQTSKVMQKNDSDAEDIQDRRSHRSSVLRQLSAAQLDVVRHMTNNDSDGAAVAAEGNLEWGGKVRGSGGRKSPSGAQGRRPGRGSGGRSPPESEELSENVG